MTFKGVVVMVTHDNYIAGFADRQFHIVDGKIFKIEENHHPDEGEDETDGILTEKRTSETEEKDASENQPIGQNEGEPAGGKTE